MIILTSNEVIAIARHIKSVEALARSIDITAASHANHRELANVIEALDKARDHLADILKSHDESSMYSNIHNVEIAAD